MKKLIPLAIFASLFAFTPAQSEPVLDRPGTEIESLQFRQGRQVYLGQVYLSHWRDQDVISVRSCAGRNDRWGRNNDRIRSIRIQVLNADADIESLRVQFGNGQWEELQVRQNFRRGSTSRWLDLRGDARCIRRIEIEGDTDNDFFFTQALVRVWGRY